MCRAAASVNFTKVGRAILHAGLDLLDHGEASEFGHQLGLQNGVWAIHHRRGGEIDQHTSAASADRAKPRGKAAGLDHAKRNPPADGARAALDRD